ncbi:MAG: hypothetical protein O2931_01680 [Planctomycetota bacterium]|nr:hypothetical protein [Planctomycetota bacterium]MDA1177483.1 hypothetical protein [Planctomycetota bacterium]
MIYEPVKANRYFTKTDLYSAIDWSDFNVVVTAFEERINNWYLEPATELANATGHYAFSIMAINCLLIDTFSQFAAGQLSSSASTFKSFVSKNLPNFNATLTATISHDDHSRKITLSTVADVVYHGFRCGILHQAHIPLYGGIVPGGAPFNEMASGQTIYSADGSACPTVSINPLQMLDDLKTYFADYICNLKNTAPQFDTLRNNFRLKFTDSFGISV